MAFGVTNQGFKLKRLSDIQEETTLAFQAAFGQGVNLSPESILGQIKGILDERISLIWELAQAVYNSQYPLTASGTSLDSVASITGITRLPATASKVTARIYGEIGTTVPIGFVASVVGSTDAKFETQSSAIIESGDPAYVEVEMIAQKTGPISAVTGSLTVIETPTNGIESINNLEDATLGRNLEADSELKLRRLELLQRSGVATVEGIRNKLLTITDVVQSIVIENPQLTTDADGRPGKSFEAIVLGGDEQELAQAIFDSKPAGIESFGDISKTVLDSQGISHTVKLSRPTEKNIYVIVNITPNSDPAEGEIYPIDGDDLIETAILEFVSNFKIGQDVIVSQLFTPINTITGIHGIEVFVGLSPSPSQSDNIAISPTEIASFDSARITVNS